MRTNYSSRYSVYVKFVGHNLKVPIIMFVIVDWQKYFMHNVKYM
jgi:hypothetical protein